tara:strand:- start:6227 stop:7447 length:1221 start_codon:yes stop_codon:yes gene_type:complete
MGFFSKVFKGVKKVVKKIGKGIKSAFAKVGKFMNKLGIVGQIALGLMLPGIGASLGKWAIGAMGSGNAVVAAAGQFVNAAVSIGTKVSGAFKTVTEGVFKVVGQTVGTALNKIPGAGDLIKDLTLDKIDITQMKNFTGDGGVFDTVSKVMTDVADSGRDLFSMDTLTAKNKLGQDLIDKTQAALNQTNLMKGPNLTDTSNMSPVELENPILKNTLKETQMSSLDAGNTTNLFTPETPTTSSSLLVDKAVDTTKAVVKSDVPAPEAVVVKSSEAVTAEAAVDGVERDAGYYENLRNKVADEYKKFRADPLGVEGLSDRVNDGVRTQFMQSVGLENKPEFTSVDNRSSNNFNFGGLQESTAIRSSNNQAFNPLEYSQNQDFLAQHTVGYGAAQWDANREYQYSMGRTG